MKENREMNTMNATDEQALVSIDDDMLDGVSGGGVIGHVIHGAVTTVKTVVAVAENVVENGVTIKIPGLSSLFGG
jgi:hypothetical protein